MYALTTHQLQVERRESHRAMIDKNQWWEFGQDTGPTPTLLFTRSGNLTVIKMWSFLMTTESQDLGLKSHPKDGAFWWCHVSLMHTPSSKEPIVP